MNILSRSSTAVMGETDARGLSATTWRRDRQFFTGLAVIAAAVVFIGFAPTYFLKAWYGTPTLPPILHAHGLLMTSWFGFLMLQTALVAARRTHLHRRLGMVGLTLATAIVVTTVVAAIDGLRARRGLAAFAPTMTLVSLGSTAQFAGFVVAALLCSRKPEAHKRLMLTATAVLLPAAVGRLIGGPSVIQALAVNAVSDSVVIAMIVYDLITRQRVHVSLLWGGVALVTTQYLQEAARFSDVGRAVVTWLQS